MGKVEELIVRKLSEYKDIIGVELKKTVSPSLVSEEDKKFGLILLI